MLYPTEICVIHVKKDLISGNICCENFKENCKTMQYRVDVVAMMIFIFVIFFKNESGQ